MTVKWNRWETSPDSNNGRKSAENRRFAANGAVKTQRTFAEPDYSALTYTAATATTVPTSTAVPEWDLVEYAGLHGYWKTGIGSPAVTTLQLWAYDPDNSNWYLVEQQTGGITELVEFRFENDVRGRRVKLLATAGTIDASNTVVFYCSAE